MQLLFLCLLILMMLCLCCFRYSYCHSRVAHAPSPSTFPPSHLQVGNTCIGKSPAGLIADVRVYGHVLSKRLVTMRQKALFNQKPQSNRGGTFLMQFENVGDEPLIPFDAMLYKVGHPEEKVVPALIALLFTDVNEIVEPALRGLANLALYHGNRLHMLELGVLRPLLTLSNSASDVIQFQACRALNNLR